MPLMILRLPYALHLIISFLFIHLRNFPTEFLDSEIPQNSRNNQMVKTRNPKKNTERHIVRHIKKPWLKTSISLQRRSIHLSHTLRSFLDVCELKSYFVINLYTGLINFTRYICNVSAEIPLSDLFFFVFGTVLSCRPTCTQKETDRCRGNHHILTSLI